MKRTRWIKWAIALLVMLAAVLMVGIAILGGTPARCVGVDADGEVVKAMGDKCNDLDQVVIIELGPDGQVKTMSLEYSCQSDTVMSPFRSYIL